MHKMCWWSLMVTEKKVKYQKYQKYQTRKFQYGKFVIKWNYSKKIW